MRHKLFSTVTPSEPQNLYRVPFTQKKSVGIHFSLPHPSKRIIIHSSASLEVIEDLTAHQQLHNILQRLVWSSHLNIYFNLKLLMDSSNCFFFFFISISSNLEHPSFFSPCVTAVSLSFPP